ncbi:hypothetical protein D9C73_017398 [Collichthys lucidus]|uniref:Uncharacterized protein n=1 Tax=Collichthys lucidus TaxID=240159 RepID=A0A4U5V5X1_COLLU|nr:hypothetical protein D9C73_017398 [Collichthys lucidus]
MASSPDSPISASSLYKITAETPEFRGRGRGCGESTAVFKCRGSFSLIVLIFTKRLRVQSDGFDDKETHKVPQTGRELKLTQQQALHEHMYRHRRQACITRGDYRLEEYLQMPKGTLDEKDFVIFDLLWITGLV